MCWIKSLDEKSFKLIGKLEKKPKIFAKSSSLKYYTREKLVRKNIR